MNPLFATHTVFSIICPFTPHIWSSVVNLQQRWKTLEKKKSQRKSEDPLSSLIQTPAHGSSLLLRRVVTNERRAAAQEGGSPFEEGTLTKQRIGSKDAPQQDTDCYQVSLLNIETSLFEHVGSVCDVMKKKKKCFTMLEQV